MLRYFFVPGQPQGKGRAKVTVRGKFAHAYTPDKTVNYEARIVGAYDVKYANQELCDEELRIIIRAVFPVPKSTSKKQAGLMLAGEIAPTKKPDADNIAKVICDALNGIAYTDDTRIVTMMLTKEYGAIPGVWVLLDDEWKTLNADAMIEATDGNPF
jgi:Holliday junction resolvase RusA-like endonuclease